MKAHTINNGRKLSITSDDTGLTVILPVVTNVREHNKDIIQWIEDGQICCGSRTNPANVRAYNACNVQLAAERTAYEKALDKIARWAEGGPVQ